MTMDVRKAAFGAVETKLYQLLNELPPMQQAVLRAANAKGMGGGVVVELVDEYKKRMTLLVAFCVEQFEWEAKHAVWPRRNRGEDWRRKTLDTLRSFTSECRSGYEEATKNINVLNTPGVPEAFKIRLDEADAMVRGEAKVLLHKKEAEVDSTTLKGGIELVKKGALAAGSAIGGYLWHKYLG